MTNTTLKAEQQPATLTPNIFLVAGMILAAAAFRLVPHPPNFTPICAMALFGGAALANRKLAFFVPLLAMFLSDLVIGFDPSRVWVYGSIVLVTLLGRALQTRRRNPAAVVAGSLAGSTLFFIVTNFGVWATAWGYTHTASELVRCYVSAIPFFDKTLLGDLLFSGALFGGLAWFEARQTASVAASVNS